MASASLEFEQLDGVRKLFVNVQTRLEDPSDLTRDFLLLAIRSTQLNFDAEGRPQRWDELAESTIRRRFAKAIKSKGGKKIGSLGVLGSIRILQNTGHLRQSFGYGASGPYSAQGGSGTFDRYSATITSNNPGAWNQIANPRTGAPERLIVLWQEQDVEDSLAMADDFVLGRNAYAFA